MRLSRLVVPCFILMTPVAAIAQADPPGRVGRVSDLSGAVSFRTTDDTIWTAAIRNYPFTTGDHLWSDRGGRGEIEFGQTTLHVGGYTAVAADRITDGETRLRMGEGSMDVRIRALPGGDAYSVDTPNSTINFIRPGLYRIDVDSSGTLTTLTVRDGEADVTAGSARTDARDGDAISISGTDVPHINNVSALPLDDLDRYATERDRLFDQSTSAQYTSGGMVGYADLDRYGSWNDVPSYGHVWYPQVAVGWAPYRTGHWAYVAPWGWTWIDDAPWGFAPFHYGRWAYIGNRWGWTPGAVVVGVRPVYAPALVGFVGGSHFSLSVSIGGGGGPAVGWFPLGPREVYVPAYSHNVNYIRQVNVTNVTNINNINVTNINVNNQTYVNQHVNNAVTAVPQRSFGAGPAMRQQAVAVNAQQLQGAEVVGHSANVSPQVVARQQNAAVRQPPQAVAQRTFGPQNRPAFPQAQAASAPRGPGGQQMPNGGGAPNRPGQPMNDRVAPQGQPSVQAQGQPQGNARPNMPGVAPQTAQRPGMTGAPNPGSQAGVQPNPQQNAQAAGMRPPQAGGQPSGAQQGGSPQQVMARQQQEQRALDQRQQADHRAAQANADRAQMEQRHAQEQQQMRDQHRAEMPRPQAMPRMEAPHGGGGGGGHGGGRPH